jgi:hypothetical protein
MKKNKLKALDKSAKKLLQENLTSGLIAYLKETTAGLGTGTKKLEKEIKKGSLKLTKKLSKAIKIEKSPVGAGETIKSTHKATVQAKQSKLAANIQAPEIPAVKVSKTKAVPVKKD